MKSSNPKLPHFLSLLRLGGVYIFQSSNLLSLFSLYTVQDRYICSVLPYQAGVGVIESVIQSEALDELEQGTVVKVTGVG